MTGIFQSHKEKVIAFFHCDFDVEVSSSRAQVSNEVFARNIFIFSPISFLNEIIYMILSWNSLKMCIIIFKKKRKKGNILNLQKCCKKFLSVTIFIKIKILN